VHPEKIDGKYIHTLDELNSIPYVIITEDAYEVDHHIPLFKGGSNEVSNLIALCRNCHGKKTILENAEL
jgi:5-methylcytosine-specific restriction endonuclease McrA